MPIISAGIPTATKAASIRSASSPSACASTSKPAGNHAPGEPVEHDHAPLGDAGAAAASVSSSAASASAAACAGASGGHRRVLTRPGTGALTMTRIGGKATVRGSHYGITTAAPSIAPARRRSRAVPAASSANGRPPSAPARAARA